MKIIVQRVKSAKLEVNGENLNGAGMFLRFLRNGHAR